MEKEHFEILLERIEQHIEITQEGLAGTNEKLEAIGSRVDQIEDRLQHVEVAQVVTNQKLEHLENKVDKLEEGQEELKLDVRDIKRSLGVLVPISNDHEFRLQKIENTLQDHFKNHP